MSKYIAVEIDDQITVHAHDATGNYTTLCGLDGDDTHPDSSQSPVAVPRGAKINCRHCKAIWDRCKEYRASDFCI